MGKLENSVETYLHNAFEQRGGTTYKFVSPGRANVPDRICIIKGHVFFVEVKQFDEELRDSQLRELIRLSSHGMSAFSVRGKQQVDKLMEFVDSILNATEVSITEEIKQLIH